MGRGVALLRAVNVGGRKLPMAELRSLCSELGLNEVATYIQSGNVIFSSKREPAALETALEQAIERRFGLKVPVIVRTAADWAGYRKSNPFPAAARDEPNWLMLLVSKQAPKAGAEEAIQARATAGEQVKRAGNVLWIHFPQGSGNSKLTPSLIDKAIGSPATSRNYRTVIKLQQMLEA